MIILRTASPKLAAAALALLLAACTTTSQVEKPEPQTTEPEATTTSTTRPTTTTKTPTTTVTTTTTRPATTTTTAAQPEVADPYIKAFLIEWGQLTDTDVSGLITPELAAVVDEGFSMCDLMYEYHDEDYTFSEFEDDGRVSGLEPYLTAIAALRTLCDDLTTWAEQE